MNTIFKNLLKAIGVMCYFIILNFAYLRMETNRLIGDIEVFSGIFLVLGILMLERAYKKDSGESALTGIELIALSMHSLSIMHVITFFNYDFSHYLIISSFVFSIYYVLKAIIIYTRDKRKYLKGLGDIKEIVKEEPIKKEAKKRNQEEAIDDKEDKEEKDKSKKTSKEKSVKKEQTKEKESKTKKSKEVKNRTKKETKKEEKEPKEPKEVKSKAKRQTKPKTKTEAMKEETNKTKRTKKAKKEVKEND